jgi:hypothetical protein
LDAAVEFIRDFITAENAALHAQYTEHNQAAFDKKLDRLKEFYADDVAPDVNDPGERDAAFFKESAESLDSVKPRLLFQVKRYEHPKLGDVYRAYVSNNTRSGKKSLYFANLYVAGKGKERKIIANYVLCRNCAGLGKVDGKKCPECKGDGWLWAGGTHMPKLDKPVEVHKLHAPDKPEHLAEYEAE